jgi:DNA-binding response OmpR family regulator
VGSLNILFADDDADIKELVGLILQKEGMSVVFADNGLKAIDTWRKNTFDLIVLDIMMPVMDGLEACRRIRRVSDIPIIMLTSLGQEQDVVMGFEVGADDYIIKPFRPRELIARIQAVHNRFSKLNEIERRRLAFKNLVLDLDARQVIFWGRNIEVTRLEFQLLQYLIQNAGIVISKDDLLQNVWGYDRSIEDTNLIEAAIRRLRKKLETDPSRPRFIQTVWGTGYRLGD